MITINVGKSWKRNGNTHARGYAIYEGIAYSGRDLAQLLDNCNNTELWQNRITNLNGSFSIITLRDDCVLAAVDRLRSIPLFFGSTKSSFYLGDNADWVLNQLDTHQQTPLAASEFILTGYVTGADTLYQGTKQLQAGEYLHYNPSSDQQPIIKRYYRFHHTNFFTDSSDKLIEKLETVHHDVFTRLVKSANGRQIVLPLSGGYDSRLIGISLRDAGVKNVICYNYGIEGSWESKISRELADYLGFRWIYIPYSADRWRQWSLTEEFKNHFSYAGNLSSVPHVQDWPAIFELQKQGAINRDSIIIPGHSGDFVAGSHIPKLFTEKPQITRREILDSLYAAHYTLWDWSKQKNKLKVGFDERIEAVTGPIADSSSEQAADIFEFWDLQERQAKFICNSLRVYDFFNYEWRLPLFDHELMDFWARIPIEWRYQRRLYLEFANNQQSLPITDANVDRGKLATNILDLLQTTGLKPLAKRGQQLAKEIFWEKEYNSCAYPPLAWFGMLDKENFKQTYTGKETLHSYLAKSYLQQSERR